MAHFESRSMRLIETACVVFPYSHKYEKLLSNSSIYADCNQLKPIYPYVERKCFTTKCIENLRIGNQTILQTLEYDYSYRTFLYAERNKTYKPC